MFDASRFRTSPPFHYRLPALTSPTSYGLFYVTRINFEVAGYRVIPPGDQEDGGDARERGSD